jgi:methionyl-tRNA formyltransferase
MRVAIVGQKDFGKAVLEAFIQRGDSVAGVFCAPEKPGEAADPMRTAGEQREIRVLSLPSLKAEEARQALRAMNVDIAILAYVVQFVPQDFATIPRFGTIQYHPSLLPRYRGPSSINWPVILGDDRTGVSIFRPIDGLDQGPVILQREIAIGTDDTTGKLYFEKLFPLGIEALIEAAELVVSGRARESIQDESLATYQGWCREAEARINWHTHVDHVYDLIRGCNPAPGAWTLFNGKKLQLFDARKQVAQTFAQAKGTIGAVASVTGQSLIITAQGGHIEVFKLKYDGGKKVSAAQFCAENAVQPGALFGV